MFPQGGPGLALVLLRLSIVASFLAIAIRHPVVASNPLILVAVALVSLCLAVGLLTPAIAVVAGAAALVDLVLGPPAPGSSACGGVLLLDAAALGLLGPGAYSVDARRFGRRVTVLPAPANTD